MKKIFIILGLGVLLNGCALAMLDETNQERHQSKIITPSDTKIEIEVVKEYYDENGDQISDPSLIKEIEDRAKT